MNDIETSPKAQFAGFAVARAATDILDSCLFTDLDEASTDVYILRQLYEFHIPIAMGMFGVRRASGSTVIEFSASDPDDDASGTDFHVLGDLQTPRGQIKRQITSLRRGGALPYQERLADRLDFLMDALEQEGETWIEDSPEPLRQMLLLLAATADFRCPTVTVTPSATFRAEWQADGNRHFALDFLSDGQVRFVVFSPDPRHPDRVQRVSGIVSRANVLRAVEPFKVHRWAANPGA